MLASDWRDKIPCANNAPKIQYVVIMPPHYATPSPQRHLGAYISVAQQNPVNRLTHTYDMTKAREGG